MAFPYSMDQWHSLAVSSSSKWPSWAKAFRSKAKPIKANRSLLKAAYAESPSRFLVLNDEFYGTFDEGIWNLRWCSKQNIILSTIELEYQDGNITSSQQAWPYWRLFANRNGPTWWIKHGSTMMIFSRVNILNGCLKGYPFGSTAQKKSVPGRSENRSSPSSSHPLCHLSNFNHSGGSQNIPCESGKHLKLPGMNPSTLPSWARLLMLRVAVELQCFIPITSDPGCHGHFDTAEISTDEYIAALNIKWEHTLGCNMMQ